MSIAGVTFDNQSPTSKDHGALFAGILTDGIIQGCGISYSGTNVTIATGYYIVAGRLCKISAAETKVLTGTSGYARIIAAVDLSGTATEDNFNQATITIDYAASATGFTALTQEDVNWNGTLYQFELAVLSLGTSGATGITRKASQAHSPTLFVPAAQLINSTADIPANAPDYQLYFKVVE